MARISSSATIKTRHKFPIFTTCIFKLKIKLFLYILYLICTIYYSLENAKYRNLHFIRRMHKKRFYKWQNNVNSFTQIDCLLHFTFRSFQEREIAEVNHSLYPCRIICTFLIMSWLLYTPIIYLYREKSLMLHLL